MKKARILLIGTRTHHAKYLALYKRSIELSGREVEFRISGPSAYLFKSQKSLVSRVTGAKWMPFFLARALPWDLVLYSIHGFSRFLFPTKKVYLGHGIDTGHDPIKGCHSYGKIPLRRGKPFYDLMTPKSPVEHDRALRYQPLLAGRLAIVGDPLLDHVIGTDRNRQRHRTELGIAPTKTVVGLFSSWGPSSKLSTWVESLAKHKDSLPNDLTFMFFVHPNNILLKNGATDFEQTESMVRKLGWILVPPDADFAEYMSCCDCGITADGSIGIYFSHLGRPLFYNGAFDGKTITDNPFSELATWTPRVEDVPSFCANRLKSAIGNYPFKKLSALALSCVSRVGMGHQDLGVLVNTALDTPSGKAWAEVPWKHLAETKGAGADKRLG